VFDPRIRTCLQRAARLFVRAEPDTTDSALLDRLARFRDPTAFSELLARHGPAVWSLCRRVVRSEADAEDVFQATFLVLVRDAARVRKAASVGSFLYGVAFRIGRKVRVSGHRTPDPVRLRAPVALADPATDLSWTEVRAALDEELARLPDALRAPILLCYFDGKTQDEAATELGWTPRAVKDRVARARALLRARFTRRGIELPAVLAGPLLSAALAPAAPPHLCTNLISAAAELVRGHPPGARVSPTAVALARTEVPTVSAIRIAVLLASALGLLAAGSLIGRPLDPGADAAPTTSAADPPAPAPAPEPSPPVKPAGAVRLGTTVFRTEAGWHKKVFFTADGKTLVAPQAGKVELWNPETGKREHEIPIPKSSCEDADYYARTDTLAHVGRLWPEEPGGKAEITIWLVDVAARAVRSIPVKGEDRSNHFRIRFTPDGKRLVTGTDGDVRVWDIKSGEELLHQKHRYGADAFALSPDGKTVAFGRYDLYLWRWESGEEPKKFTAIGGAGTELVTFGPDSKTLYVADRAGRTTIFDVATARQTGTLDLGGTPWKWAFSPDGATLATVYYDTTQAPARGRAVVLWDPATGKERGRLSVGRTKASFVSWSADGSRLTSATDHRLWAWDVKTQKPLGPAGTGHEALVTAFAFGPDGLLFSASDDHTIRSWDAAGKPGLELIHSHWVRGVAVSPDGALVAGSALENDLRVWNAKSGNERFRLLGNGEMGGVRKVGFTSDGKRLVAWGDDIHLRVYDMRTGKLRAEHLTLPDGITRAQLDDEWASEHLLMGLMAADISADGSTFALCRHKVVQVFDVETGKERARFEVDPNGAYALGLSPDGKRLAVGGRGKVSQMRTPEGGTRFTSANEHQMTVWDIATKKVIWQTTSPGSWTRGVAFSPDGTRLGETVSDDDKRYALRVWEAAGGKDLGRVELGDRGYQFAFDHTGKRVAVSFRDTTAMIHDLDIALKPIEPKK
jgi:RNA polymerase sigma factor (sigma-70 family)